MYIHDVGFHRELHTGDIWYIMTLIATDMLTLDSRAPYKLTINHNHAILEYMYFPL